MASPRRLKLRFSPEAERQLDEIANYIARDNPHAAWRTIQAIRDTALLLRAFPDIGRRGLLPSTRERVVSGLPYLIVYRVNAEATDLAVIEIVHGARRSKSRNE